jgi:hypothetical protein
MTESQIESRVERLFNSLDRQLIAGRMTQPEYDFEAQRITDWADEEMMRRTY